MARGTRKRDGMRYINQNTTIFLNGDIQPSTYREFLGALLDVDEHRKKDNYQSPLYIHINSDGGDFGASMSIARHVLALSETTEVVTIAAGEVASGAFMIWLAGNDRLCTPYASITTHSVRNLTEHGEHIEMDMDIPADRNLMYQQIKLYKDCLGYTRNKIVTQYLTFEDIQLSPSQLFKSKIADAITNIVAVDL